MNSENNQPRAQETGPLECGHPGSDHSDITRGYGRDADGKRYCYACCTQRDLELLADCARNNKPFGAYLVNNRIQNWPGHDLGLAVHVGKKHPFSRERNYIRATDNQGNSWYGTGSEGMWATIRPTKKTVNYYKGAV